MEGGPSIQRNNENSSLYDSNDDDKQNCDIGCCDPRRTCHRFIALFFMCLLGFGKLHLTSFFTI